jgi:hypothetical protein
MKWKDREVTSYNRLDVPRFALMEIARSWMRVIWLIENLPELPFYVLFVVIIHTMMQNC